LIALDVASEKDGFTPFHMAAQSQNPKLIMLLLHFAVLRD